MPLAYRYDVLTGGVAALLSWSFFVLCTPVADAVFLPDCPLRVVFGVRMIWSEIAVWGIAIAINLISLIFFSHFYEVTFITKTLKAIRIHPWPYWGVILLSAAGTFLSIRFGDELMDVSHQRERKFYPRHYFKHELILFAFLFWCCSVITKLFRAWG